MRVKLALLSAIVITSIPVVSFAESNIYISNNTDKSAVANLTSSPCSAEAPMGKGVIKPGQENFKVPTSVVSTFCKSGSDCVTNLYMAKDCSGKATATANVNPKDGSIGEIINNDSHYNVVKTDSYHVVIKNVKSGWKSLFNFL